MTRHAAPPARRSSLGAPLPPAFYNREADMVARDLLGTVLEHRTREGVAAGRIVEVEAYLGPHDPACHAAAGLTERTKPLHGPPGTAYVYFIYGMHWCVNAVTREQGYGSAVLIRAIEPLRGLALMRRRRGDVAARALANGPGKLCQALGIDGRRNAARLDRAPLRILAGDPVADADVIVTPRIGISKAADWPLRWVLAGHDRPRRFPRPR